jgi:hypothetical protein
MASRPHPARHDPRDRPPPPGPPDGDAAFGDLLNGFSLDSHRPPHGRQPHDLTDGDVPALVGEPTDADGNHRIQHAPERHDTDDDEAAPSAVRAYAWTGGRTTPQYRLELETLLSTTERYRDHDDAVSTEYHAVAALCHNPTSVAEVAALLRLPLGIAKVLTGDMAASGLLAVHDTASTDGETPDLSLMERILSGLRRL